MKVTSRLNDLRNMFSNISASHISENLQTCGVKDDLENVLFIKKQLGFDVLGYEDEFGFTIGYVNLNDVKKTQQIKLIAFEPGSLISNDTRLLEILKLMNDKERLFVIQNERINGIITRGDLQKAPVRLFFTGLITLFEMNLQKIIESYQLDNLNGLVSKENLVEAKKHLEQKKKKNIDIGIFDCLYLTDKCGIAQNYYSLDTLLKEKLGPDYPSKFKKICDIRNDLFHPRQIARGPDWNAVIMIMLDTAEICETLEQINSSIDQPSLV